MSTSRVIAIGHRENAAARFQRILVATDFSVGAHATLGYALGIARRYQSKVFLVHVIPAEVLQYVSPEGSEEMVQQAKKFAARETRRLLEDTACEGMVQEEILCGGRVWPRLQDFAKKHEVDLIVAGTHGRSAVKRELLGPVVEAMFRFGECPILTVTGHIERPGFAADGVRRILYATSFKPHSERAAAFAHSLEREHGARLTVLHVVEDQQQSRESSKGILSDFMLRRMRKSLPAECMGNCEPEFQVRFGDPGEQILSVAREQDSDLIILGLRAGDHADGQLPSAVAYKLVCQATCPVLTTRL